jgi:putative DNA primase/helicase
MSKSNPAALRIVDGDAPPMSGAPRGLNGLRRASDASLEFLVRNGDAESQWQFLCSPICVVAVTRNSDGQNWGRLIEIVDADGRTHRWAMPASMLANSRGELYRETLFSLGARVAPGHAAAGALHRYLLATVDFEGKELPRARAASRLGWHDGTFVLRDRALGGSETVVYQSASAINAAIRSRRTLEDWQNHVAKPSEGNSRIAVAICAAFAAPLLQPLGMEGAGIHFRGESSVGKTTALQVAGSVWGGPCEQGGLNSYKQTWQATANGVEGMAQAHCDLPLCLDELGLIKGDDAARIAYQFANGIGRARANKTGSPAPRLEWRVFLISTGELRLADKIAEGKTQQRVMAGQEVRFIDLPADAEKGFGIFDHAPEIEPGASKQDRGRALADQLNDASQSVFGTAGPAFVEAFIEDREHSIEEVRSLVAEFVEKHAKGAAGQVQRVARTFGLIAAAGELAISCRVLPWEQGTAVMAASSCFAAWLANRGTIGASEISEAISHVRGVIERDGSARFQRLGEAKEQIRDRLGYVRPGTEGDIEYLILPETWKTLFTGRDAQRIARQLATLGILVRDSEGRPNQKLRINGSRPQRTYVISHAALFDEGDGDG